ncbi:ash family protein [Salmonella enterica]|nr:ash family protein [Salmonella enterica]
MRNNNTQRVKGLPFTVCNAYVQCTAWRTSIAVFHISAISRMRHAACNGAVCFPYAGFISILPSMYNSTSRRPRMVTLAGQPQGWPVSLKAGISTPVNVTAPIERGNSSGDSLNNFKEAA